MTCFLNVGCLKDRHAGARSRRLNFPSQLSPIRSVNNSWRCGNSSLFFFLPVFLFSPSLSFIRGKLSRVETHARFPFARNGPSAITTWNHLSTRSWTTLNSKIGRTRQVIMVTRTKSRGKLAVNRSSRSAE